MLLFRRKDNGTIPTRTVKIKHKKYKIHFYHHAQGEVKKYKEESKK
jgi:hypothetical protein